MTDEIDLDEALRAARERVLDELCGYGEAMFIRGNPHNRPDPRLDQKAFWQELDRYERLARAVGAAEVPCAHPKTTCRCRSRWCGTGWARGKETERCEGPRLCESCEARAEAQRIAREMAIPEP